MLYAFRGSCLAVICFSSPALCLSWQRPTPGRWVPFIYVRERPREKLLLHVPGSFKPVEETGKSASYSLCSQTLLPGLQLRGRGSKHCGRQSTRSRRAKGVSGEVTKPPRPELLDFRRLPGLQCCSPTLLAIDPAALLTQLLSLHSPVSIS